MAKGKKQKKRHWKSLKDKTWAEAPGHGNTRKLSFCSIIMKRMSFRKGLEKTFAHSTNYY